MATERPKNPKTSPEIRKSATAAISPLQRIKGSQKLSLNKSNEDSCTNDGDHLRCVQQCVVSEEKATCHGTELSQSFEGWYRDEVGIISVTEHV